MEKFVQNCKISFFSCSFFLFFYFMKKYCLVLKLCYFKVYNISIFPKNS